ncbi:MAG: helix-turn-helix domain-containing protein [Planctomycetes bacterium]|nr:helix-turn-helix domain-containing protein [Planctomycetota bacterium]
MQKRANAPKVRVEPWRLDPSFPVHVLDWRQDPARRPLHHVHGAIEFAWCRSGSGIFMLEERAEPFAAGEVFVIGGSIAHAAHSVSAEVSDWTFAFIDATALLGGRCDPLLLEAAASARGHFRCDDPVGLAIVALVDEFRRRRSCWRDVIRARVIEVLVAAHRLAPRRSRALRSLAKLRILEPALAWIGASYASTPSMASLARRCGLSQSQFRRVFAAQCGSSPREYLLAHRVAVAAGLLATTDRAIADIALAVGFPSLSSFNRQFLRRQGCSPRVWRERGSLG